MHRKGEYDNADIYHHVTKIVDQHGIDGLKAVAERLGVKGVRTKPLKDVVRGIREHLLKRQIEVMDARDSAEKAGGESKAQASKGTSKTAGEVIGGMKTQSTDKGVRLDHDYDAGKQHLLDHGGELVGSRRGMDGTQIETYRVRAKDKDVLATWGQSPVKMASGHELPRQWQFISNSAHDYRVLFNATDDKKGCGDGG
jgi:hypothetical protein